MYLTEIFGTFQIWWGINQQGSDKSTRCMLNDPLVLGRYNM